MSANLSKGNFFSQYLAFRWYIFQMLSFYIRQYFDRDDDDKDLSKDTLSGLLSERGGVFANVYRHEQLLPN